MNNFVINDHKQNPKMSKYMNDTQKKNQLLLDWLSEPLPNHLIRLRWLLLFVATLFLLITNDKVELLEVNLPFIKVGDISSGGLMCCLIIFLLAILIDFGIHTFLHYQQFKHHKDIVKCMKITEEYNAGFPLDEEQAFEEMFEKEVGYQPMAISYKTISCLFYCKFFFNFVIYIIYGIVSFVMLLRFAYC